MSKVNEASERRFSKGIYLLPNLFTIGGLFSGFYAVIAAMKGLYDYAAITIFIAMVADGLDGRVARLTNTMSDFGAEFDSLSDMVAFGVAPAVTAYSWALSGFGKVGWLIAFFYTAATALRLARFNIHVDDEVQDKRFFSGLPSPAAAGLVTSTMWIEHTNHLRGLVSHFSMPVVTIFAAAMMVSNIRYYSFKTLDFRGKVPFIAILLVVLVFMCIAIDPPSILFLAFSLFAFSGFVSFASKYVLSFVRKRK